VLEETVLLFWNFRETTPELYFCRAGNDCSVSFDGCCAARWRTIIVTINRRNRNMY